jgi:hypothetical protein
MQATARCHNPWINRHCTERSLQARLAVKDPRDHQGKLRPLVGQIQVPRETSVAKGICRDPSMKLLFKAIVTKAHAAVAHRNSGCMQKPFTHYTHCDSNERARDQA